MRLFLLRHGLADRDAWDGPDFERPLTQKGVRRMEAEAATLARLDLGVERILTSPLTRARQTAEVVARRLGLLASLAVEERLGFDFGPRALAAILADHRDRARLLLVGHEPGCSETVGAVTGGGEVRFKKGGLARLDLYDLDPPAGELVWLLPPKIMAHDG